MLECRRPDLAYIEYLAASEIVINAVPRNKDFPMLEANGGRWSNLNKELRTVRLISTQANPKIVCHTLVTNVQD